MRHPQRHRMPLPVMRPAMLAPQRTTVGVSKKQGGGGGGHLHGHGSVLGALGHHLERSSSRRMSKLVKAGSGIIKGRHHIKHMGSVALAAGGRTASGALLAGGGDAPPVGRTDTYGSEGLTDRTTNNSTILAVPASEASSPGLPAAQEHQGGAAAAGTPHPAGVERLGSNARLVLEPSQSSSTLAPVPPAAGAAGSSTSATASPLAKQLLLSGTAAGHKPGGSGSLNRLHNDPLHALKQHQQLHAVVGGVAALATPFAPGSQGAMHLPPPLRVSASGRNGSTPPSAPSSAAATGGAPSSLASLPEHPPATPAPHPPATSSSGAASGPQAAQQPRLSPSKAASLGIASILHTHAPGQQQRLAPGPVGEAWLSPPTSPTHPSQGPQWWHLPHQLDESHDQGAPGGPGPLGEAVERTSGHSSSMREAALAARAQGPGTAWASLPSTPDPNAAAAAGRTSQRHTPTQAFRIPSTVSEAVAGADDLQLGEPEQSDSPRVARGAGRGPSGSGAAQGNATLTRRHSLETVNESEDGGPVGGDPRSMPTTPAGGADPTTRSGRLRSAEAMWGATSIRRRLGPRHTDKSQQQEEPRPSKPAPFGFKVRRPDLINTPAAALLWAHALRTGSTTHTAP